MKIIFCFLSALIFFISTDSFPQSTKDTINKPIQFRRGAEIPSGYQSYEEKYGSKDLQEEKRRLYPIDQITSGTGIWTELNPRIPRVTYAGIYFVNRDTGWAVGDLGTIIKTMDGGANWSVIETNTIKPLLKVRSYNGQIVLATGYDGLILRSTDSGESFSQVPSGVGDGFDLWGLETVNDTLGWACGSTALLKTIDAGQNWQLVNTPGYTGNLWWIEFMPALSGNENYGFIAADGKVLRTSDSGVIWEIIQAGDNQPLYCVDIIDSLHIAAGGYGGTSYRAKNVYSSDGGYTWISGGPLTFEPINCISYVNTDTGYAILNEVGIWKTTNRGISWLPLTGNFGEWEFQLFTTEDIGYDAGSGLKLYKADVNFDEWHRIFINDNFSDVFFVNEQKGFVISSGAYSNYRGLYKTTDGGVIWQYVSGALDGVDLYFLDSLTGFIGASSTIYKTIDGGSNWYQTQGTDGAGKIFFINQITGWAIHSNVIYKTTDKGENWFIQNTAASSISYYGIYFIDSLYGWTANLGGRPFRTTNGGANWIEQTDLDIWESRDIYFRDPLNGFIVNDILELFRTTDSGLIWFTQFTSQYIIRTFGWLTSSHGFIIGDGVYETIDSGDIWNENLELRNIGLRNLQSPVGNLGYASGYLGLIYKYVDTTFTPVELKSFSVNIADNNILLEWTTETEINNRGFAIERQVIAPQSAVPKWEKIGFVEGNGTTSRIHSYSFTDKNVTPGKYKYHLKQIDFDGSYEYSKEIEVEINNPKEFYLGQNYPNPFNPVTQINYQIPVRGFVSLKVYDLLGEEVATLANEEKSAGSYEVKFDRSDLPSGVYICRLVVEKFVEFKKMMIIK